MKRLICCLGVLFLFAAAFGQRSYFIYLQTEPEQPFFVKANDKVFSSTASGYLILTRLEDSTHTVTVGFPQNKWPEQQFKVAILSKDHGFLLKYFAGKGWGLVDLQTSVIQMAVVPADKTAEPGAQDVSLFTDVLAKAANDPSLREKPVAAAPPQDPAALQPVAVAIADTPVSDSSAVQQAVTREPVVKQDEPVVAAEPVIPADYRPSIITRRSESSTTGGFGLTFTDEYADGTTDTIRIMIPNPRSFVSIVRGEQKDDKQFLDIPAETPPAVAIDSPAAAPPSTAAPATRNYCADTATESDFRKLRKKMASQNNDDDMVTEAAKYFRTKCFSVEQVRHLGALLLLDSGKYKLFDAAYTHVSDIGNFPQLESALSDKYYITRFRAMLRN